MLILILFAYFNKLQEQIDILKEAIQKYFPNLAGYHSFLKNFPETHKNKQSRNQKKICEIERISNTLSSLDYRIQKVQTISSKSTTQNSTDKSKQESQQQYSTQSFVLIILQF
ncbi:unnamed protein product [Paramecium octaurelia]|uniref:Uncharacterized protein n=1 Tax=Paramecium octaurelia TaxID=43137 RepID=A0A8S1UPZ8_PAROT|nr:unnamed protein product [Paramecium octaurelia]